MSKEQHLSFLKIDIDQAKKSGLLMDVSLITKGCCEECEKVNGLKMSFKKMLKNKPLPYSKCSRKTGCICCYGFHPIRDTNGRLIRVKK